MKPFRAGRKGYSATFSAVEADLLGDLTGQLRTLLAQRSAANSTDPLAELTGLSVAPADAPADPALARLLPSFHREDANLTEALRMLHEPEIVAAKDDAASSMLETLPVGGGAVHLDETQAKSWLVCINDIRLVLGVRLDVTEDAEIPAAVAAKPAGPEHAMFVTYQWLTALLESLTVSMLGRVT